ncbi:MAG TPA: arginine--tRNA ligase [Solirubrobacteraceae bacterium]|jgi:arginyl-tRNA synthetase|nr:arginine--tRNA ligase [Solirubrobacteraceae bacterium]
MIGPSSDTDTTAAARTPLDGLRAAVLAAAAGLAGGADGREPEGVTLERPPQPAFGDYSTNAALLLAPRMGVAPREAAARLGTELKLLVGEELERFEVAGPGFVNLFMADRWLRRALGSILDAGERYGAGGAARGERILVEFVSANPTGPMHVGHARNAAYGDALARLLALHGHEVTREFYVNDAGSQVGKLGDSILALAQGRPLPEDGYRGEYVAELAATLTGAAPLDAAQLGHRAVELMVERMRASLTSFGVGDFDSWQFESELHEGSPSKVEHALKLLEQQGHTYRQEGALWLRTTPFGDDKDRVLVRSNGEHTYFASDIAYHLDKRERGYERQIDVWGADHHGYVARMKAAYVALGGDEGHLEMLIMQLVHLVRRGERAQMSKRAGEFVTLEDLVGEIGVDAARWYLLSRSHDTTIDLDLDLARAQSSENPVYYVQYAHARIASMLTKAGIVRVAGALEGFGAGEPPPGAQPRAGGGSTSAAPVGADPAGQAPEASPPTEPPRSLEALHATEPLHPSERALIKRLLQLPGEVREAAQRRAPHRIATYALQVAQDFTAFYRDCHVVGAEPAVLERQRIALCVAARGTITRCLEDLLGVTAPREM